MHCYILFSTSYNLWNSYSLVELSSDVLIYVNLYSSIVTSGHVLIHSLQKHANTGGINVLWIGINDYLTNE